MNRKISAGVAAVLFSTSLVVGYHFAMAAQNAVYCVDHGKEEFRVLAINEKTDGSLDVGLMAWIGEGEFSFFGNAKKTTKDHWLFEQDVKSENPDDRCSIDIAHAKNGWTVTAKKEAPCSSLRGDSVKNYQVPAFSASTYAHPVTVELANPETLQNILDCKNPPKVFAPSTKAP